MVGGKPWALTTSPTDATDEATRLRCGRVATLPSATAPPSSFHADHHLPRQVALASYLSSDSPTPNMATAKIASLVIRVSTDGAVDGSSL